MNIKKYGLFALVTTILATLGWVLICIGPARTEEMFLLYATGVLSVLALCAISLFIASLLTKKRKKIFSAPVIFAIVDASAGIAATIFFFYTVYRNPDLATGLLGVVFFIIFVPITGILLVIDLIYILIKKILSKKKGA